MTAPPQSRRLKDAHPMRDYAKRKKREFSENNANSQLPKRHQEKKTTRPGGSKKRRKNAFLAENPKVVARHGADLVDAASAHTETRGEQGAPVTPHVVMGAAEYERGNFNGQQTQRVTKRTVRLLPFREIALSELYPINILRNHAM